ncbi:uncharacterized protein LOC141701584 [Apium graveolens]|uniref:uncharacterized protein LOC141701584 n=1 Tax=Apium graveolens TaxID=4045 RepID=UPI003D79D356
MEVYIDDMVLKSVNAATHVKDLEEVFDILRSYNMKLNPSKCNFAVSSGKFLGHMVTRRDFSPNLLSKADEELRQIVSKVEVEPCILYTDGASNVNDTGLGLVLKSPQGDILAYSICCEFKATNNEAEYEALIIGLTMAIDLEINHINVYCDSLLIVNHVNGNYEVKDEKMTTYLEIVKELRHKFTLFNIQHIPRE